MNEEQKQRNIIMQRFRASLPSYEIPVWQLREQIQRLDAQREWREQRRADYPFHGDDDCPCWLHAGGRQWCWLYHDMERRRENLTLFAGMIQRLEHLLEILREVQKLLRLATDQEQYTEPWPIAEKTVGDVDQIRLGINMDCWKYQIDEERRIRGLQDKLRYGDAWMRRIDFVSATSFVPERLFEILQVDYLPLQIEQGALRNSSKRNAERTA